MSYENNDFLYRELPTKMSFGTSLKIEVSRAGQNGIRDCQLVIDNYTCTNRDVIALCEEMLAAMTQTSSGPEQGSNKGLNFIKKRNEFTSQHVTKMKESHKAYWDKL